MLNKMFFAQNINIMGSGDEQLGSDYWTTKKLFSETGRVGMVAISDGTHGYFGLGRDEYNLFRNDWYKYDPSTNTITTLTSFPGDGRSFASICIDNNNKIIISGGYSQNIYYSDSYHYNISLGNWETSYDLPIPLAYHSTWVTDDSYQEHLANLFYIFNGYNNNGLNTSVYIDDFSGNWNVQYQTNKNRIGSSIITADSQTYDRYKHYRISGFIDENTSVSECTYDSVNGTFTISNKNVSQSASHLINNKIFTSLSNYPLSKTMNIYDINDNIWTINEDYNYPDPSKTFTAYFDINNKGYVIGGGKTKTNSTALGGNTPIENLQFYPIHIWEFHPPIITLQTTETSSVTDTKILNTGGFNITDYEHITSYGIQYKQDTSTTWDTGYQITNNLTNNLFTVSEFPTNNNLIPNTNYMYKAYVKVKDTFYYGDIKTITTTEEESYWVPKKQVPGLGRVAMVGISDDIYGYFGLGRDANDNFPKDWYKYDNTTNDIIQLADFPGEGRASASITIYSHNGIKYIIVGLGARLIINTQEWLTGMDMRQFKYFDDLYRYNTLTNTWSKMNINTPVKLAYANMAVLTGSSRPILTIWNGLQYDGHDKISNNSIFTKTRQLNGSNFSGEFNHTLSTIPLQYIPYAGSTLLIDDNWSKKALRVRGFMGTNYKGGTTLNTVGDIEKTYIQTFPKGGGQMSLFNPFNGYIYGTLTNYLTSEDKDTYRYNKYENIWEKIDKYQYPDNKKSYTAFFTIGNKGYTVGGGRITTNSAEVATVHGRNIEFDQNYIWEFRPDCEQLIHIPNFEQFPSSVWGFNGHVLEVIDIPTDMFNIEGLILYVGTFTKYTPPNGVVHDVGRAIILTRNFEIYKIFNFDNSVLCAKIVLKSIFFGGDFTKYVTSTSIRFCQWFSNNDQFLHYTDGPNSTVHSIDYQDRYLYIGGHFTTWSGTRKCFAILDINEYILSLPMLNYTFININNWTNPASNAAISTVRCIKSEGNEYILLFKKTDVSNYLKRGVRVIKKESSTFTELNLELYGFPLNATLTRISNIIDYDSDNSIYLSTDSSNGIYKLNVASDGKLTEDVSFNKGNGFQYGWTGGAGETARIRKLPNGDILVKATCYRYKSLAIGNSDTSFRSRLFKIKPNGDIDNTFNVIENQDIRTIINISNDRSIVGGVFCFSVNGISRNFTRINHNNGQMDY